MSTSFDLLDRRVLAGLRLIDPLGQTITGPVSVETSEAKLLTKQAGLYVVLQAEALAGHDQEFIAPPATPSVGSKSLAISIKSHSRQHLSRQASLRLPRDPDPAKRDKANSLFRWADIVLPYASAGAARPGIALACIRITRAGDNAAIEGAVVRLRASGLPEQIAVTNSQGEAHCALAQVPLSVSGGGASVTSEIDAECDAIIDPALARFHDPAELLAAKEAEATRQTGFIDPDDIVTRLSGSATSPIDLKIASGRTRSASIVWSPP